MEVHNLIQGSPEWHAYRRNHFNASDAPAMMGCSPYKSRDELIAELATGITPEVDDATQARFNDGHRFEALARPLAEKIIGEELAPLVGSEGKLSASFDGLTLMGDTAFEHKSLNNDLRAVMVDGCTGADLHLMYRVQMEQQHMVSGAERVLFMASKWERVSDFPAESHEGWRLVEERHCWYTPDPALRAEIAPGWAQLEKEVAAYVAPESAPVKVVAEAVTSLPAVLFQASGTISLVDNFPALEVALRDFINHRLVLKPETDQDFANLDLQIKALKNFEGALDAGDDQMFAQLPEVDRAKRTKDMLHKLARDNRLMAEKLLTTRKDQIRSEVVQDGLKKLSEHIAALNTRLGKPYMPAVPADFAGAIKGKRTIESLRDGINTELARAKIAANEIADRIQLNLNTLREQAMAYAFLFADAPQLVMKANDDLQVLIKSRIADHQAAELAKEEQTREKIRIEEELRAANQQAEKNRMAMSEISGIRQQVAIAQIGRAGVRKGGTIECIRETLEETKNWPIEESNFGALTAMAQSTKDAVLLEIEAILTAATTRRQLIDAEQAAQDGIAEARAEGALPTPLLDALSDVATFVRADAVSEIDTQLAISAAQRSAAASPAVVPLRAAPPTVAPTAAPSLKLGQIAERLAPIGITADGLASLGFKHAANAGASKLYHESDFPLICAALVRHIEAVQAKAAA